jgi:hypothetical protein
MMTRFMAGKCRREKQGLGKKHRYKDKLSGVILRITVRDFHFLALLFVHFLKTKLRLFAGKPPPTLIA